MRHPLLLMLLVTLMGASPSFCQTRIIHGTVSDRKTHEPVPFATVLAKNSSRSATTDEDGRFSLIVPDSTITLAVNYLGYEPAEVKVKRETSFVRIELNVSTTSLPEVTVITHKLIEADKTSTYATYSFDRSKPSSAGRYSTEDVSGDEISNISTEKSGILTAGEINDFGKWILWKDIEENTLKQWRDLWKIQPEQRFVLQLETENGMPVINATAQLTREDGMVFWNSITDNTGKAELWLNLFGGDVNEKGIKISVTVKGEKFTIEKPKEFHKGINVLKIPVVCNSPDAVDVAFVVDATGSMQDEIDYLKAELNNIIGKIRDSMSDKELNLGCVFYRDVTDAFITKKSDLSPNVNATINFIKSNNADGGGDYPEAVDQALNEAINHLSWRENAVARIIFLVLDAPPHDEALSSLRMLITEAATRGIRVVPVACSGIDKSTEYLMRSIALATNGTYVFLTDHSGVGGHHIEPTTDKYDVELLNGILFRVIYNFSHTEPCEQRPVDLMASADTLEVINPLYARDTISDSMDSVEMMDLGKNMRNEKEDAEFFKWKYYPNPTFGIVHVVMEGELNELFVTDISGKILLRYEMKNEKSLEIDLSDFPSGTYFISGEYAPEKIVNGRIVLVH